MKTRKISHLVTEGDSLSDRGTLNKRYIMGIIPMSWISGLVKYSPRGRFTNGLAWSDHVIAMFANVFLLDELKKDHQVERIDELRGELGLLLVDKPKRKYGLESIDISDAIIAHDAHVEKLVQNSYSLDDDRHLMYKNLFKISNNHVTWSAY